MWNRVDENKWKNSLKQFIYFSHLNSLPRFYFFVLLFAVKVYGIILCSYLSWFILINELSLLTTETFVFYCLSLLICCVIFSLVVVLLVRCDFVTDSLPRFNLRAPQKVDIILYSRERWWKFKMSIEMIRLAPQETCDTHSWCRQTRDAKKRFRILAPCNELIILLWKDLLYKF